MMGDDLVFPTVHQLRAERLIWPLSIWPKSDRTVWVQACSGSGPCGRDNAATLWSSRTSGNNQSGYGRYLAWLSRRGLFAEEEALTDRVTRQRVAAYTTELKGTVSAVSAAAYLSALAAAVRALDPSANWSWLSRKAARLKIKAQPSRDKRQAMQHTRCLYRFGKWVMDTADPQERRNIPAALRYQAGLIIALLAARPLRVRNFQAITLGKSLQWDGSRYWLSFGTDETKTRTAIHEPLPGDLVPYLETFLRIWRPILIRQTKKFRGDPTHRRLWVDRQGDPMAETTLRSLIKRYTEKEFGRAVWPHLFRDCLLTSLATDEPDLMAISANLLGHSSVVTGEKHYNQARMVDAGRRFSGAISRLRRTLLAPTSADA